ncbi:hypothetical protein [Bradyrhizobium sp. Ec3.3]|uniref:hypothetical protein n=1 Tax=Bradyrhizobium sp. Ec3.3 TaxID=189753 RepID=UPI0012ECA561|nr:hypothetical protein [Bradyrhizobium sp. Ec3.3]
MIDAEIAAQCRTNKKLMVLDKDMRTLEIGQGGQADRQQWPSGRRSKFGFAPHRQAVRLE